MIGKHLFTVFIPIFPVTQNTRLQGWGKQRSCPAVMK